MRLIDADGLMQNNLCGVCGCTYWDPEFCPNCKYYDVRFMIEAAPTIEAEPVRHGHWIIKRDEFYTAYNMYYAECSECKHTESTGMTERLKYCPNCGAKMDGGAENV